MGSPYDDDGAWNAGAIWLLYLNPDGTVKSHGKISQTQGRFGGIVGQLDYFGWSVDSVDLDGDGVLDLVTGEVLDDFSTEEYSTGAIWWLFLNPDGTVRDETKVNQTRGGFTGDLDTKDQFGVSVAVVGDLDGDRVPDTAVGAVKDDDGGTEKGAIWILFQNRDGTVKSHYKISDLDGAFPDALQPFDWLASSLAGLGDLDGDHLPDLAAGARFDDDGVSNGGAVYMLFLDGLVPPPEARFTTDLRSGDAPLEVAFRDTSLGPESSRFWDFGDGTSSLEPEPRHVYATPGTYAVTLTVNGPGGTDVLLRADWIQVTDPAARGSVTSYGCGENPAGSLEFLGGEPRPGGRLTFGADNPLGTQNPGTIPRLAISLAPDPAFPCGTPRANFGLEFAGAPGGFPWSCGETP